MRKIAMLSLLLLTISSVQGQIDTKTIELDNFFVVIAKLKKEGVMVVSPPPTVEINSGREHNNKHLYIHAERLYTLFGNLYIEDLAVELLPLGGEHKPTLEPTIRGVTADNVLSDSIMILSIWRDNERLYASSDYKEIGYISIAGKAYKNSYQANDVKINNEYITAIKRFYHILGSSSKKKKLRQLETFAKTTEILSLREKCATIVSNNKLFGNDFGDPINK